MEQDKKETKPTERQVDAFLNEKITRRQALSTGAKAAIGIGAVIIVGAGAYLAYNATQGGTTISTTSSSSATNTTSSSLSTSTSTAFTSSSVSQSKDTMNFNIWPYKPELVQISVDHFNNEHSENLKLGVISASYFATITQKLRAGTLDINYATPQFAHANYHAGLLRAIDDIHKDTMVKYDVQDAVNDMKNGGHGAVVDAYTATDGHLIGLPYFTTSRAAILTNELLLAKATPSLAGHPPATFAEVYTNLKTLHDGGVVDVPYLPHWYSTNTATIPWALFCEVAGQKSEDEIIKNPLKNPSVGFDTNTFLADVLKQWKAIWDAGYVTKGVLTLSVETDWEGAFSSGKYAYSGQAIYDITTFNDPSFSKIAGHVEIATTPGTLEIDDYVITNHPNQSDYRTDRQKAMEMWFGFKNDEGDYETAKRLATAGGIATISGYSGANTSKEVLDSWSPHLVNPAEDIKTIDKLTASSVFLQSFKLPWFETFATVILTEVPQYLLGQKTLDQLIGDMKTSAQNGIKGSSSSTTTS